MRATWGLLLLAALGAGCTDDDDDDVFVPPDACSGAQCLPDDGGVGMDGQVRPEGGTMDSSLMDTSVPDTSVPPGDAQAPDGTVADASPTDAQVPVGDAGVGAPTLTSAQGRQVGPFGDDLGLSVFGTRGARDIVAARVELLDAQQAVLGTPLTIPLTLPITGAQGGGEALLAGALKANPGATSARLVLLDDQGQASAAQVFAIVRQMVLTQGEACDEELLTNRCGEGLGCRGPGLATCQLGVQPMLTDVGYFVDELGPRILLAGIDPDRDVARFTVTFFDEGGERLGVDLDNDPSTPLVEQFTDMVGAQEDTSFFKVIRPSEVLVEQVASVRIQVVDQAGLSSADLPAMRLSAPVASLEAPCDPRGFDRCPSGALCSASGSGHVCTTVVAAKQAACGAALVLDPGAGTTQVRGSLVASLWEPPEGCSSGSAKQPDQVVKLVLSTPYTRVVLSTDHPYTSADTELYVLRTCNETPRLAWCVADQPDPTPSPKAVLTLMNPPVGEYYVVVDSFPLAEATGDEFELTVSVEP